ncbi:MULTISPECIES: hypothetical protein [unclassified Streptomyces]|uniref:hypothetical protein n=1 Tax=unclassified Streptomyces TaxID=2593676 RepID=UPI002251541E|nr:MULTISPECIES: hypothetical protein [unclassified Streptomyces]MCX4401037.1 hypothetical protein [Streptomyces sp. NBC_01764]MCX5184313.1 hypothetical protein [Streptomyces sp. NBC_00268]
MSTGLIIALIVIVAVAVVAAALILLARRPQGGRTLRRRFGPEYDRAVAQHDGDARAAERDLAERVKRHGALREQPLEPAARDEYAARWGAVQERFVDSPQEAVAEADRLVAELAGARGFPDGERYEEQLDALSVHHGHHVHGYRRVHQATYAPVSDAHGGTEELRASMVEARALFEDLLAPVRQDARQDTADTAPAGDSAPDDRSHRAHVPWAMTRRHAKGS